MSADVIRVAQLSDTHFVTDDDDPEGGFAYDTAEAFAAVHDHLVERHPVDLVAVTGDVADHGRPAQYRRAADAFARFAAPVNVCPGNHDLDATFTAGVGRPGVATSRVIEAGDWCFLFVDSNSGAMDEDHSGRLVDPAGEARLHRNGALGDREAAWIAEIHDATDAAHVFVWLHHPPGIEHGMSGDLHYQSEWRAVLDEAPRIRGFAGGHTHVPGEHHFEDRPVFVAPALKHNFDLDARTFLPPGYRTYEFAADGAITSGLHLGDDERWPRHPMGRAVHGLITGQLSSAEFDAIVARKRRQAS